MPSPYRADHVGSLLRPPELLQARETYRQNRISLEQLRQAEDAAILKALELQREVGIDVYTEGEYRRSGWSTSIRDSRASTRVGSRASVLLGRFSSATGPARVCM